MAREKKDYRETLELITELYPGRSSLNINEAAAMLGVHAQTIRLAIERKHNAIPAVNISSGRKNKKYIISIPAIARWMAEQ